VLPGITFFGVGNNGAGFINILNGIHEINEKCRNIIKNKTNSECPGDASFRATFS
jgi:hypothetical protein